MTEAARSSQTRESAREARAALKRSLLESGLRCTGQREAVHAVLWDMRTHPTADEIYHAVRERVPRISLATVYNALEAFEKSGVCLRLAQEDGPARYDIRVDEHHHLKCVDCGRLMDVEGPPIQEWLAAIDTHDEFEIHGGRLLLEGRCSSCGIKAGMRVVSTRKIA
ncbi:MAG: Fur family transcriptional regulator [Gemmatimonadota bacterium]